MYKIEIRVLFRYGHRLLPPYFGKCNNPHGEGGTAIFIFESNKLKKTDMVEDFGRVKRKIKKWIDTNIDHSYIYKKEDKVGKYLKKHGFRVYEISVNPTAENIAKLLFWNIKKLFPGISLDRVGVVESFNDSIAWYDDK